MSVALSAPHALDPRPLRVERLDLRRRAERLRFYEAERVCRSGEGGFRPHFRRDALYWMDPAGSPALEHADSLALCASRGAEVVGRVLAVRPPGAVDGLFSAFCCRDDEGAARALIDRCGAWLRALGCARVVGPVGLGVDDGAGVPVRGGAGGPVEPPHLARLLEAVGLQPAAELAAWTWPLDVHDQRLGRLFAQAARTEERLGLQVRTADLRHLERELPRWRVVAGGLGPTRLGAAGAPASACLFLELARAALPESVIFAELDGRPVGVAVTVPDTAHLRTVDGSAGPLTLWRLLRARHEVRRARLRLLATLPEAAGLGIEEVLLAETARRGLLRGWTALELVEVPLDDHAVVGAARALGAARHSSAQVYAAPL
ncbi:MAG: hypothetical protein JNM72_07590 [Deltaproteobacteria bacterium]|jgi:hypothetical protein|nr:hypothetical protein [Deltaproteobacteria bacterium]